MTKTGYLTIDDAPSTDFLNKLDFLTERGIFAIWFCQGNFLEARPEMAIEAIKRGHWIGNHSYSHPHCSELPVDQIFAEIRATDAVIRDLYKRADLPRPHKLFRFPFGDKGGARRSDIQGLLPAVGFQQPPFRDVTYAPYLERGYAADADCAWTVESYEYRVPSADDNLALLRAPHDRTGGSIDDASSADILLIHDHPATTQLFIQIIDRLMRSGVEFTLP